MRPIDIRKLPKRDTVNTDYRLTIDKDNNQCLTKQPDKSLTEDELKALPVRDALVTDKRLTLDSTNNFVMTNQPDNSAIGTAASKDTGTAADQIPLNSDLGDSSLVDVGTAQDQIETNALKDFKSFDSLTSAIAYVTANPDNIKRLDTSSYRSSAECTTLGISYPDGGGASYVVLPAGTGSDIRFNDAGSRQLKLTAVSEIDLRVFGCTEGGVEDYTDIFNNACAVYGRVLVPFKSFRLSVSIGDVDANGATIIGSDTELVGIGHIENAAYTYGIKNNGYANEDIVIHPTIPSAKDNVLVRRKDANTFDVFVSKETEGYALITMLNKGTTINNSLATTANDITAFRSGGILDIDTVVVGNRNKTSTSGVISDVSLTAAMLGLGTDAGVNYVGDRIAGLGYIEYTVDIPIDTSMHVMMRKTNSSSADVKISVDGVDIVTGIDLSGAVDARVHIFKFDAPFSKDAAVIRVENLTAQNADVYGVNTSTLSVAKKGFTFTDYGYYRFTSKPTYVSQASANDYAMLDSVSGLYGGSYHGGETNIVDTLLIGGNEILASGIAIDDMYVSQSIEFASTLKIDWSVNLIPPLSTAYMDIDRRTVFTGNGFTQANTFSGDLLCNTFYETLFGMDVSFTKLIAPRILDLSLVPDESRVTVGNDNSFVAENPATKQRIRLTHSSTYNKESNLKNHFYRSSTNYLKYYSGTVRGGLRRVENKHSVLNVALV